VLATIKKKATPKIKDKAHMNRRISLVFSEQEIFIVISID
jgi:hypothetical protein